MDHDIPWYTKLCVPHIWTVCVMSFSCWLIVKFIQGRRTMRRNLKDTQEMLEYLQRSIEMEENKEKEKIPEEIVEETCFWFPSYMEKQQPQTNDVDNTDNKSLVVEQKKTKPKDEKKSD
ncbi:hypothetical protein CBL_04934 [Carabus blaptoides fortunei]